MSLPKQNAINISGIRSIEYAFADEFSKLPNPDDNMTIKASDVTFKPGYSWKEFYFTRGTIKLQVKQLPSSNGNLYGISIKLNYPMDNSEATRILDLLSRRGFVLKMIDNNGIEVIYGTATSPLLIIFDINKGARPGSENDYDVEIAGKTQTAPGYIIN